MLTEELVAKLRTKMPTMNFATVRMVQESEDGIHDPLVIMTSELNTFKASFNFDEDRGLVYNICTGSIYVAELTELVETIKEMDL